MTLYFERKLFDDSQRMRLQIMMTLGLDLITTAHLMPISLYKSCNVREPQFSGMPSTFAFCLRFSADAGDACVELQCLRKHCCSIVTNRIESICDACVELQNLGKRCCSIVFKTIGYKADAGDACVELQCLCKRCCSIVSN